MTSLAALVALAAGAVIEVPAGAPVAAALAAARPGDVVRLGPGLHAGSLGALAAVRIEGAGAGATRVVAPEGTDGAVVRGGAATLSGLSLEAGPGRCALRVLGGEAALDGVALEGGSCGAFLGDGRLVARRVSLRGGFGLLVSGGEARVDEADVRAEHAGVAVVAGAVTLRRSTVTGPSHEGGVSVARGTARLEAVVIRAPGPSGLTVSHGGTVEGTGVTIAGAALQGGVLGACAEVIRGTLRLEGATLVGCAGAAVEVSGGEVRLAGVDATGGSAGCVILADGSRGSLAGSLCAGRGPGLVVSGPSRASLVANRWLSAPASWVDCDRGARVEIGRGERMVPPCGRAP